MTLREAWEVLGKDPDKIMQFLSGLPNIKSRAEAIEEIFEKAKRWARDLMVKNHPDVNPSDSLATEKFKKIQLALSVIELHTKEFHNKVEKLSTRKSSKDNVIIVVNR
jgi:hypothetical protein